MHDLIMGRAPNGVEWDHKNRNPLDNRRDNLRLATHSQNLANRGKQRGSYTSKYKGVDLVKGKYWRAQIRVETKKIYLGLFKTEVEAARAYDLAALAAFGEFAVINLTDG